MNQTLFVFVSLLALSVAAVGQEAGVKPDVRTYKSVGGVDLKAHVFLPPVAQGSPRRAAIVLLHGGGWNAGSPEWMYDDAKRYASLGLVAIAGECRLSDQKAITPLEAMADVRDLIRWVRSHAEELHVDAGRVVVNGYSAGGHLAICAAVFPHPEESAVSAVPDALMLLSPAASIVEDHWAQILLGSRGEVKDISPAEHIQKRLPPAIVFEGSADTETPLTAVKRFCDAANRFGGVCELHVYPNLGHILTRNLDRTAQEQGPFDPDPAAVADSHAKGVAFLKTLGYAR